MNEDSLIPNTKVWTLHTDLSIIEGEIQSFDEGLVCIELHPKRLVLHITVFRKPEDVYPHIMEAQAQQYLRRRKIKHRIPSAMSDVWNELDQQVIDYIIVNYPEKLI